MSASSSKTKLPAVWILLLAITLLGAALRFYAIEQRPFTVMDPGRYPNHLGRNFSIEAETAWAALELARGTYSAESLAPDYSRYPFRGVWAVNEGHTGFSAASPLVLYPLRFLFEHVSPNIYWFRILMALVGALTVPLFYLFLRRPLGSAAALAGAFFLACSHYHIAFSRMGIYFAYSVAYFLLVAMVYRRALEKPSAPWYLATGLLLAAGTYLYLPVRILWIAIPAHFFLHAARHRGFIGAHAARASALFGVLIVFVALQWSAVGNKEVFGAFYNARGETVFHHHEFVRVIDYMKTPFTSIFHPSAGEVLESLKRLGENAAALGKMLFIECKRHDVFSPSRMGLFNPLTGLLAAAGLFLLFSRRKDPTVRLYAFLGIFALVPALVGHKVVPRRALLLIPFVLALAAYPCGLLFERGGIRRALFVLLLYWPLKNYDDYLRSTEVVPFRYRMEPASWVAGRELYAEGEPGAEEVYWNFRTLRPYAFKFFERVRRPEAKLTENRIDSENWEELLLRRRGTSKLLVLENHKANRALLEEIRPRVAGMRVEEREWRPGAVNYYLCFIGTRGPGSRIR